jgi:DNA-binding beta-propeller fold protein YncE
MVKYIIYLLLFSFLSGQFFEGYIPLPQNTPGVNYPWVLIYNQNYDRFYLVGYQGDFAVLNGENFDTVATLCFRPASFPNGDPSIFYLPENNRLYLLAEIDTVFLGSAPTGWVVFNPENNRIIDTIPARLAPGAWHHDIVYNPINNRVYINEGFWESDSQKQPNRGDILVVDNQTNEVIDTIKTFGVPGPMAWNPNNNRLYVHCVPEIVGNSLNIIDCQTNRIIDTIIGSGGTRFGGDLLYNPSLNKVYFRTGPTLTVVDCSSDSVIAEIPISGPGWWPLFFVPQRNKIYTSNSDTLFIIDCLRDSIRKIIPGRMFQPVHWIKWGEYNPREDKVYLATSTSPTTWVEYITILDGETDSILTEIPIYSMWMTFDPNRNRLYSAFRPREYGHYCHIAVIDGESNQIIDTIITGGFLGGSIVWNPINNKIYASTFNAWEEEWSSGGVLIIDGATHQIIKYLPIGREMDPNYGTINTRRNKVYWTSLEGGNGNITVIDGERDTVIAVINVGSGPCKLDYNFINDKVYCADYGNGLAIIDGAGDTIITYCPLPFLPAYNTLIWHPGVNKVYCGSPWDNRIAVIDGETNEILKIVTIAEPGFGSYQYAFNLTNNKLYITYDYIAWGGLAILDCLSDSVIFNRRFGAGHGICWNAQNNKIYFSYELEPPEVGDYLGVLDCETDSLIRSIPIPGVPYHLIWNPENNKIYCDMDPYGVGIFDGETDSLLEIVIRSGASHFAGVPFTINYQNHRVYFACVEKSRILVLKGTPSGLKGEEQSEEAKSRLKIYPNPARRFINIAYSLTKGEKGRIKIFDATGRKVKELSLPEGGENIIQWNGDSNSGRRISPGIYFLRLERKREIYTQKIIWQE